MVVKKKSTKKTTKTPIKKTTNRGRPKKEFKLKTKRTGEEKKDSIRIHTIPQKHKIKNSQTRERSILYLFVFSVILFVFSLSLSFYKNKQTPESTQTQENGVTQEDLTLEKDKKQEKTNASNVVKNFYTSINSKNFEEMYATLDTYLLRSQTIKTYFSEKRLTRFINNTQDGKIHISNIQEENINEYTSKITYTLDYTLLDQSTFEETRTVTIISRNDEQKISAIRCETSGCSRMPFFNPGKYNIN